MRDMKYIGFHGSTHSGRCLQHTTTVLFLGRLNISWFKCPRLMAVVCDNNNNN